MSEIANAEGSVAEKEKPVLDSCVEFPPFPEPTEEEFEEDIDDDERDYYRKKFADLNTIKSFRLHCTACDRHLGTSTRNDSRMRAHPMLRTLVCQTCHTFYNSGEFEKGDDGSELYCRWCGQGGQVYCCSDCPHVFCAKCIKRNLGIPKIKEIENTDDWKCFKCNPRCLWDLRAICWALLRYCDLKNKTTYQTQDAKLKEAYQKDCALDHSECCKNKQRRKERSENKSIKKEPDSSRKSTSSASSTPKFPSTIQVKKFASINIDSAKDKKPTKRPASPNKKPMLIKNPIAIVSNSNLLNHINMPPLKKIRMPMPGPVRMPQERKQIPPVIHTYPRIRPKPTLPIPIMQSQFNGYNNSYNSMVVNDNINLSLESLTQGLDMNAVAAMSNNCTQDDDVVCTPDFPMEPLCEVTEENTDDDVQCITPANKVAPKITPLIPPQVMPGPKVHSLTPRTGNTLPDLNSDNIIQMTDNDVTVNSVTGGLKFRVDPQTLSSNKMYRLPDGRIFAINANPNMPGGYSATIVAVTETGPGKITAPKGATYAAKLSAVTSTPNPMQKQSRFNDSSRNSKRNSSKSDKVSRGTDTSQRECDLHVPVEWYRYNLVDAVDALEYSLSRLQKLKKEATTMYLRTRTVDEMRSLHRTLERLLSTSSTRFNEIRENLNKELKQYVAKKSGGNNNISDDDDDVEILPDLEENDDPIYIDENSVGSSINESTCENQEVDLTRVGSSDNNDSSENKNQNEASIDKKNENVANVENESITDNEDSSKSDTVNKDVENSNDTDINLPEEKGGDKVIASENQTPENDKDFSYESNDVRKSIDDQAVNESKADDQKQVNGDTEKTDEKDDKTSEEDQSKEDEKKVLSDETNSQDIEETQNDKSQDAEMSEEMIETLLKDDNVDEIETLVDKKPMDVVESL